MPLFECRGAGREPWFAGFQLTLEPEEIAVLSGPSGSGKTLLLRALADLDPLEAGELALNGRGSKEHAPAEWRRRVMYLHQDPVRLPGSVRDNLACIEALRAHRGKSVAPPAGMDPTSEAARLSGGEAQRLALHRALAVGPEVLLLDEASSALDADSARAFEARVRAWVAGGRAALWVAHDSGLAERLGARTVAFP